MSVVKQIDLFYKDNYSDKEYHLVLEEDRYKNRYKVTAKFGPKDGTLTHVDKTKGFVTWDEAIKLFNKTEKEKRNKGYEDIKTDRQTLIDRVKKEVFQYVYITPTLLNNLAEFIENYVEEKV